MKHVRLRREKRSLHQVFTNPRMVVVVPANVHASEDVIVDDGFEGPIAQVIWAGGSFEP